MFRLSGKSEVKVGCLTIELPLKLSDLSMDVVGGMCSVAVKCIDITQNSDCEGSLPNQH